jgi:hypothetical protein
MNIASCICRGRINQLPYIIHQRDVGAKIILRDRLAGRFLGLVKMWTTDKTTKIVRSILGPRGCYIFLNNILFHLKGNCVLRMLKNSFAIF